MYGEQPTVVVRLESGALTRTGWLLIWIAELVWIKDLSSMAFAIIAQYRLEIFPHVLLSESETSARAHPSNS